MSDNCSRVAATDAAPSVRHVLIVEDELLIRMSAAEQLRDAGYRVTEAATADEAQVLLMTGNWPDVLFTEINMPRSLTGFELAEWVQQRYPKVKIILTSGGPRFDEDLAAPFRAHAFLYKPYPPEKLTDTIKRLLEGDAPPR